eukprot:TRINITY_DN62787_c0_g1_i1.p1 TRINITY_DN62787_c0_g1~~TRINITY_DN62787_c0_g1_i1.p1  ORF type:complete len:388 (-),score=86.54 TRINITY_DN62787_c0_g1_i1:87-1124(-)
MSPTTKSAAALVLKHSNSNPEIRFEDRFRAKVPPWTNAGEAATRVYNRGGVLVRSDPFIKPMDRFGQPFAQTKWYEPPPKLATPKHKRPPEPAMTPLDHFKKKVLERAGAGGIHALARTFRVMDSDGSRRLDEDELRKGLQRFGLNLSVSEIRGVVNAIDTGSSSNATISFDEFLLAVRGDINSRRQKLIDMAYHVLDRTGDGVVNADDIAAAYNVGHDPDVLSGRKNSDSALRDFLSMFDRIQEDGVVTQEEFTEYYRNVSASVDDDDYFELMIRNAWHISGGEGWCENTANTRLLVVFRNGKQRVVELENDLGLDLNDYSAVLRQLEAQGYFNIKKFTRSGDV